MVQIEVKELNKIYQGRFKKNSIHALKDFNLSVSSGNVFGLLGPNGAGKTTLVKILLGITFSTSGRAKIFGQDVSNYVLRKRVGYLPENHKFPLFLNAEQLLKYYAELCGFSSKNIQAKINYLLDLVKLQQWKKIKIKKYSKGMMQRLGLAQSLIHDPELLFLDEPTDGVDPIGRKEIRDMLIELKDKGKTIFINSHLLSEIEMVSDRVAILNKGVLIREGTVEDLTTTKESYELEFKNELSDSLLKQLNLENSSITKDGKKYLFRFQDINEMNKTIDQLRAGNMLINSIIPKKMSLEESFINMINDSNKEL